MKTLKNPVFRKVMEFSTAHISQRDSKILEKMAKGWDGMYYDPNLIVVEYDYGYIVWVPPVYPGEKNMEEQIEGFSEQFKEIISIARSFKCEQICFDCDGREYEELKKFDW